MREPIPTAETKKVGETAAKVPSVRGVKDEAETIITQVPDQIASLPAPVVESSNSIGQIKGVLNDLRREEDEEEVSTPLRAPMMIDEECALVAHLEEQGPLMATNEMVAAFSMSQMLKLSMSVYAHCGIG